MCVNYIKNNLKGVSLTRFLKQMVFEYKSKFHKMLKNLIKQVFLNYNKL